MSPILKTTVFCCFTLCIPQLSQAAVFMCVDPETGKKTFTDKACPTRGTGDKVHIETTNFGSGVAKRKAEGTWSQDRYQGISGSNYRDSETQVNKKTATTSSNKTVPPAP